MLNITIKETQHKYLIKLNTIIITEDIAKLTFNL